MKRLLCSVAALIILASAGPSHASVAEVEAFVSRFYEQCLNREPDQAGLDYWTNALLAGTLTGADVANGFVFSPEFTSLNTSNEDYLTVLYLAFFDRNPDAGGFDYWLSQLNSGMSRQDVLDGFIYAQEFYNLCFSFGISPNLVASFVERFYLQCLDRPPDLPGLSYWVNSLFDGSLTGADVANGFVFSPEFTSLNPSNADYLNVLYFAFFDRNPDPGGYNYWLALLNDGAAREFALDGFVYAQEFVDLCGQYGITPYLPLNCTNIAGEWFLNETEDLRGCGLGVTSEDFSMTIAQAGCSMIFIDDEGPSGAQEIVGDLITFYDEFQEMGGTVSGTWNITISGNGTAINGLLDWTWTDGNETCFGATTISGTRVP